MTVEERLGFGSYYLPGNTELTPIYEIPAKASGIIRLYDECVELGVEGLEVYRSVYPAPALGYGEPAKVKKGYCILGEVGGTLVGVGTKLGVPTYSAGYWVYVGPEPSDSKVRGYGSAAQAAGALRQKVKIPISPGVAGPRVVGKGPLGPIIGETLKFSMTAYETKDRLTELGWVGIETEDGDVSWEGADLEGADLEGANLNFAFLDGANFIGAHLERAQFYLASLYNADFREADLRGADLREADLDGTNLCGADLKGAKLDGASLKGARADSSTVWPKSFDPKSHGVIGEEGEEEIGFTEESLKLSFLQLLIDQEIRSC